MAGNIPCGKEEIVLRQCIKKGICIEADSLNKGKSLSKNGRPVAFMIEKSNYNYHMFFFVNHIKCKEVIDCCGS